MDVDVVERVEGGVEFSSGWLALHLLLSLAPSLSLSRQGPFS